MVHNNNGTGGQYTKHMPLKVKTETKEVVKIPLSLTDQARLIQHGKDLGMTKRKAGTKILSEFLRKNVKLEDA